MRSQKKKPWGKLLIRETFEPWLKKMKLFKTLENKREKKLLSSNLIDDTQVILKVAGRHMNLPPGHNDSHRTDRHTPANKQHGSWCCVPKKCI